VAEGIHYEVKLWMMMEQDVLLAQVSDRSNERLRKEELLCVYVQKGHAMNFAGIGEVVCGRAYCSREECALPNYVSVVVVVAVA
jgi:hypothetical protein